LKIKEIDVEGFKIQTDQRKNERIVPDYFNTPLIGLWEITRACNLRCIFCYNNSGKKLSNELTHEQKINVAKQIVGAKIYRMCISGGEPILSPSFWDIAKIFKDGRILCNTITNGWNINEENVSLYTKYFYRIQISLDGKNEETHDKIRGRKGSWNNTVNACKLIHKNRGKFIIAVVVTPSNIHEISELIDFAYALGAEQIRIGEVNFIGRAAKNISTVALSSKQTAELKKIVTKKQDEYNGKMMDINFVPKNQYWVSAKNPPAFIYILPDGTCGVDAFLPFLSSGSLKEKSLEEIWTNMKSIHKNKDFINYCSKIKSNKDFQKLDKIHYIKGELHD